MRAKIWMIVVATMTLCVIWVGWFIANSHVNDHLTANHEGGGKITIWKVDSTQIVLVLVEIGATILAAVAVSLLTTRQPKQSSGR